MAEERKKNVLSRVHQSKYAKFMRKKEREYKEKMDQIHELVSNILPKLDNSMFPNI